MTIIEFTLANNALLLELTSEETKGKKFSATSFTPEDNAPELLFEFSDEKSLCSSSDVKTSSVAIGSLKSLQSSRSAISPYFASPQDPKNVVSLCILGNNLSSFPDDIEVLNSLQELSSPFVGLGTLPYRVCLLTSLVKLDISNNKLSKLPHEFGHLTNLRSLEVQNNKLIELPSTFSNVARLEYCNASGNALGCLPSDIGQMKKLEVLILNTNRLTFLPDSITQASSLRHLWLAENRLEQLPPHFEMLQGLEKIVLRSNSLQTPPWEVLGIKTLTQCTVDNNPIDSCSMHKFQMAWKLASSCGASTASQPTDPDFNKKNLQNNTSSSSSSHQQNNFFASDPHHLTNKVDPISTLSSTLTRRSLTPMHGQVDVSSISAPHSPSPDSRKSDLPVTLEASSSSSTSSLLLNTLSSAFSHLSLSPIHNKLPSISAEDLCRMERYTAGPLLTPNRKLPLPHVDESID